MNMMPHPVCGCLKPEWCFRASGPCDWCLIDIEREYGLTPDPRMNDPIPTVEDFRKWRKPLLEATDWVDVNPARVAREPEEYVAAIRAYREMLFAGTENYDGSPIPPIPERP